MDPGPFFYTDKIILFCLLTASTVLFYSTANKHLFPHYTVNPLFQQNRWDWQLHYKLGQSILVVLCVGSTLLLTSVVRPATSQLATPSEVTPFSYWSIKPWFLTEGKLAAVLIIPSSWGSPTVWSRRNDKHHQAIFLAPLPGRKRISARGVSHLQSLYFVIVCLVYFILSIAQL